MKKRTLIAVLIGLAALDAVLIAFLLLRPTTVPQQVEVIPQPFAPLAENDERMTTEDVYAATGFRFGWFPRSLLFSGTRKRDVYGLGQHYTLRTEYSESTGSVDDVVVVVTGYKDVPTTGSPDGFGGLTYFPIGTYTRLADKLSCDGIFENPSSNGFCDVIRKDDAFIAYQIAYGSGYESFGSLSARIALFDEDRVLLITGNILPELSRTPEALQNAIDAYWARQANQNRDYPSPGWQGAYKVWQTYLLEELRLPSSRVQAAWKDLERIATSIEIP